MVRPMASRRTFLRRMGHAGIGLLGAMAVGNTGPLIREVLAQQPRSDLLKLRMGTIPGVLTYTPYYVAKERGMFEQGGVDLEIRGFDAGPPIVEAIIAGDIDLSVQGSTPLINAAARNVPIWVIGPDADTTAGYKLISKKRVKDVPDLRGKKVGVPKGTSPHFFVYLVLRKFGMAMSDVRFVDMLFPDLPAAFLSGDLDAAMPLFPDIPTILTKDPDAKILYTAKQLAEPPGPTTVLPLVDAVATTQTFAANHREVLIRFLKVRFTTMAKWLRGPDQREVVQSLVDWQNLHLKRGLTFQSAMSIWEGAVEPDLVMAKKLMANGSAGLRASYTEQARFLLNLGILKQVPNSRTYINVDFLNAVS